MRKTVIYCGLVLALCAFAYVQQCQLLNMRDERDKYKANTSELMKEAETYKTSDGLNAAKVGELRLQLDELKQYRAEDLKTIEALKIRRKDLSKMATAQTETRTEIAGAVRDSVVYVKGDTVEIPVRCFDYSDKWTDIHACEDGKGGFNGVILSRDSLLMVETVKYKRFLFWRTKRIKNRHFDIVSKNPRTKIMGAEYISIEK